MSRPNQARTISAEENVAKRIEIERKQRGWTYAFLAERMAEVGCVIQPSAIQKIEKSNPRRRITVDEFVAYSRVFGIETKDLIADLPAIWLPKQQLSYGEAQNYVRDGLIERDDLKIQVAELQQENQNLRNEIEELRRNQRLSSTQQYINSW